MNILLITILFIGFMVSELPRVSLFGYFPLYDACLQHTMLPERMIHREMRT